MRKILPFLLFASSAMAQVQLNTGVQVGATANPLAYTDVLSSTGKQPGTIVSNTLEYQNVAGSATQTLINYTGSGYVSAFWINIGSNDNNALIGSTINVYYDGHVSPDISVPVGYFFGIPGLGPSTTFAIYNRYTSTVFHTAATNTISYTSHIPMPFSTGIKIDMVNGSSSAITMFSQTVLETGVSDTWPNTRHLFVATTNVTACTLGSTLTLANITSGIGRYMGISIYLSGGTASDQEGNFTLYLNGGGSPVFNSSGFEDYFETGNNWQGVPPSQIWAILGQIQGVWSNNGSYASDPIGAFRYHMDDPITYTNGFKLTWMCGDPSEGSTGNPNVNATIYYYLQ